MLVATNVWLFGVDANGFLTEKGGAYVADLLCMPLVLHASLKVVRKLMIETGH